MSAVRRSVLGRSRAGDTRRRGAIAATALLVIGTLGACTTGSDDPTSGGSEGSTSGGDASTEPAEPLKVTTNLKNTRQVSVDHELTVEAASGSLRTVEVSSKAGRLSGRMRAGTWTSTGRLEPGVDYTVTSVGERSDGSTQRRTSRFHTADLSLDDQTYPSVAPLDGETVGVGMPVVVTFDVPVTDKKAFERNMTVTSTPQQRGSWHWMSDTEAHWRPASYWKAGTDVSVDVDVNSVPAGNGVYGQESRTVDFSVGDAVISKVNAQTHQMQTFVNGELARTIPITTGKEGFTTRSGVKVIMEKFESRRMASETIGIADESDPDYYDLDDVKYAMRLTYSGEFLHAAPWSVGSQGSANVSHGCTGMSTEDAGWLFDLSKRGDVVEYTGTDRPMTLTNGYGDWNLSAADYAEGSALG